MHNELSQATPYIPNRIARTKARMQMAAALLSAPELPWQAMSAFLDEMLPGSDDDEDEATIAFGASVASDWQSLAWYVVDDRDRLLDRMGENVQRAGAPASALLPLIKTSVALGSRQLGCWCRGAANGLSAGWSLPGEVPLARVTNLIPAHRASQVLGEWARRIGVDVCRHLAQSYLGAASHTSLQLPLPGENLLAQVSNALKLFEELGVEGVPDGILTAIAALVPATARVKVFAEMSNTGLTQIGLVVPQPSLRLILHLHEAAAATTNSGHNDRLAALQGTLGAAHIESVRCLQTVQGFRLEYTFYPLVDDL
jgi:hypothetical protein